MINVLGNEHRTCSMQHSEGGGKPPQADQVLDERVTSTACQVLRVYHALEEFTLTYWDSNIASEITNNLHENTPHFAKLQNGFNSLKDRVKQLETADPRITKLFAQMVSMSTNHKHGIEEVRCINNMAYDLIGKENIIEDHPFTLYGIVCIKDDLVTFLKPENVITESELKEMIDLKSKLLDPNEGLFKIKGNSTFIGEVKSDVEKLLTFPEGRILAKKLIAKRRELVITQGEKNYYFPISHKISLNNKPGLRFGDFNADLARMLIPPYITLAHELIHGIHHLEGKFESHLSCQHAKNNPLWSNKEEKKTIGDHKKVKDLTENGFIRNTFHLLRKYHQAPPALDFKAYTLDEKIYELKLFNRVDDLIDLINENELTKEQAGEIIEFLFQDKWISDLIHKILDIAIGKEVFKDPIYFETLIQSAIFENDIEMVKRLTLEFEEECEKIEINCKGHLVMLSLMKNMELTSLLIEKKFHLELKQLLTTILKRKIIPISMQQKIKAVVENRKILDLTEEDLIKFRDDTALPGAIAALFVI